MSLPYINYVERDQKFTKLAFRAPNHFQPLSQFTEMAQEVSFDSLDRRGSPSGVNGTMPIEWESLLGDPLGMNPAHSLVDQSALPEFMFDMSGLGQTPTITPDALSSDLADLSVAYQSVAADIPKSQRRQRDLRTLQTIIKAESLSLVGAHIYRVPAQHWNGSPSFREKHVLPHPIKHGDPPRRTEDGILLQSPDWTRSPTYNADFIDAVVIAVSSIDADATTSCTVSTIKKGATTYFRQMAKNYRVQEGLPRREKENKMVAKTLDSIHDKNFQLKL